jgi:hypothetical protein
MFYYICGSKFFKVIKILSLRHLFLFFLLGHFYHVKTHLWMIMMESRIVMDYNIVLLKNLTTFDSIFFIGIKI